MEVKQLTLIRIFVNHSVTPEENNWVLENLSSHNGGWQGTLAVCSTIHVCCDATLLQKYALRLSSTRVNSPSATKLAFKALVMRCHGLPSATKRSITR